MRNIKSCNVNGLHVFDCSVKRAEIVVSAECCVYTAINVPYSTLNALITQDQYERSVLNDVVVMHQVGLVEMPVKNYAEANIVTVSGHNGHGGFMVLKHW